MSHYRVFASVSGGKDSGAMALHLREVGVSFSSVFCDTGWEHPDTYAYIRDVLDSAIGPITWLRAEVPLTGDAEVLAQMFESRLGHYSAFVRVLIKKSMFPSRVRRFCTEELKVKPIMRHLAPVAEYAPGLVVNAVGIRAEESASRAELSEWEIWMADARVWAWRPLIAWTADDVVAIHRRHGLKPNPLYLRGASRVGCWPCIHAKKSEIALVARDDDARIGILQDLESLLTESARARCNVRAEKPFPEGLDDELAQLERELRDSTHARHRRTYFQHGPTGDSLMGIRDVVEWARTSRGGRQYPLFDPLDNAATDGCMRWGMCETEPTRE
jgi:3'-phosphoadenosine 5'-phosphosulfate sulfotransferase (PAPS reductase)/FAD synthetase